MIGALLARARQLPQPARFLLAGGGAAAINWLVRFPLSLAMPFLAAVLVAAVIGMAVGFVAYRGFVFPPSARPLALELRDFLAVNIVTSLAVTAMAMLFLALLSGFVADAVLAEGLAHGLAIGAGAVLNYLGHSIFTFAGARPAVEVRSG